MSLRRDGRVGERSHLAHAGRRFDQNFQPLAGPCSVFRTCTLPQGGPQVLGANLKSSESEGAYPSNADRDLKDRIVFLDREATRIGFLARLSWPIIHRELTVEATVI